MKVTVNVKTTSKADAGSTLDLVVGPEDTVASVKDRIAVLQVIPFPDQDLQLNGEVLPDGKQLSECGVKEQSSLDLVVRASEASLTTQLADLLRARDLSCDELSLLYCYKHGVSVTQALEMLGLGEKLQDFVGKQKTFQLENNKVSLVRQDTALKPFSVAAEVEQILAASPTGTMEIKELCVKFTAKYNVSLSSLMGMKPTDWFTRQKDTFALTRGGLVSLRSAQAAKPQRPVKQQQPASWDRAPGLPPADRWGQQQPAAARWGQQQPPAQKPAAFLEPPPGLGGTPEPPECASSLYSAESQPYLDLHNKICSRSFNSRVVQCLSELVDTISEGTCLNVARAVKGGSVGKGTSISGGDVDAEVVFFLKGLPATGHEKWLPSLARAVAGTLADSLADDKSVECIKATDDSVQLRVKGLVTVDLRFSPVYASYAEAIKALGSAQGPEMRRLYAPALVEERVQFILRQPSSVKVTIRLLKWWRDQQAWSGNAARPSDEILELMAIYSAVQTKPPNQCSAVANVMALLSRFDELRIVWSNYYTKNEVWAPLLRQRPLLMDPVNPYVNIADPQSFDPRELMALAQTTHFFW